MSGDLADTWLMDCVAGSSIQICSVKFAEEVNVY